MLMNLTGDDDRRDNMLQKFVRPASQALGIPGSFISVLDDKHQHVQGLPQFRAEAVIT